MSGVAKTGDLVTAATSAMPPLSRVPDVRGVALTTLDERAAQELATAVDGLVAHRAAVPEHIARALVLDPGLVVGHVLVGLTVSLLGRRDLAPTARAAHRDAARSLSERGGTAREGLLVEALGAWCDGEPTRALATLETTLELEPLDLLALKVHHALCFYLGESQRMRAVLERALPSWKAAERPGLGAVLGCHAFALTEAGEAGKAVLVAEEAARAGRDRGELDPWGKHAAVHAFHVLGRAEEALDRIATMTADLEGASNFAGHVRWHEAQLWIERGEHARALALHDEAIAIYPPRDFRDVVNSTTLLYRLETAGVDVGDRWRAVADVAETMEGDHGSSFADVHYVLALLGARRGPALDRFVESMEAVARSERGQAAELARDVGLEVVRAIAALERAPRTTTDVLERLSGALPRLGGSRAQRQIFRWIQDDAVRRAAQPGTVQPGTAQPGTTQRGALS